MSMESSILKGTGIALEKQAYDMFGAAVNNQTGGFLEGIFGSKSAGTIDQNVNPIARGTVNRGILDTNNYAAQIADGKHGFDPKNKFMFRVSIQFDQRAAAQASSLGVDANLLLSRNLSFVVKNIDLPKYEFEYDEFNYYNFRTKMLKRIKHSPLSFKMYDDVANTAVKLLRVYLEILQPVARRQWSDNFSLEGNGFAFERSMAGIDTSHRAAIGINGDAKNILSRLIIDQYYLDRSNKTGPADRAIRINRFTFTNPRLDSFDIDDQDYDNGSDPHLVSCTFDYDALNVQDGLYAPDEEIPDDYPGLEILGDRGQGLSANIRGPQNSPGGGGSWLDPFTRIIGAQGGRLAQTAVTNALYRSGMGNVAGGALSGAISTVGSTVGGATASGVGVAAGIFAPKQPLVADTTSGGKITGQTSSGPGGG